MDIVTFEKAEQIVKKIRALEKEYDDAQRVISDVTYGLVLASSEGEHEIKNKGIINNICFLIDDAYQQEITKLYTELENIQTTTE